MRQEKGLSLSVIIATKDRFEDLARCLRSLTNQSEPPETVIIVDASKKEGLEKIAKHIIGESCSINLIYEKSQPGLTYQRNKGLSLSRDDLVLFLDDDVILDEHYIRELKKIFREDIEGKIGGATGKLMNMFHFHPFSILIRKMFFLSEPGRGEVKKSGAHNLISDQLSRLTEVEWLPGFNQAYRKEVFRFETFDENMYGYSYLEDLDFSYRVGKRYKLVYTPNARIIHNYKDSPQTRLKWYEKQKMYMVNYYYLFKKLLPQRLDYQFCHYWSYLGQIIRSLVLLRNLGALMGTLHGIWINISGKNPLLKKLECK